MNILLKKLKKYLFGCTLLLLFILLCPKNVLASDLVIFEFPPNDTTVVNKTESVTIKGFVKKNREEINSVQISFDGQIWRKVVEDKSNSDNFYHWHYPWTASGKGKNFIQISVKNKNGEEDLALKMIEVKSLNNEQEEGQLREILEGYKQEILNDKNKAKAETTYKDNIIFLLEYLLNKNVGEWIDKNWQVLLFGKRNLEYTLNFIINSDQFIRKYPIGKDLLNMIVWPVIIFDALITIWLIFYGKILTSLGIFQAKIANLLAKKQGGKTIQVFNAYTLEVASYIKLLFRNSVGKEYVLFTDKNGLINLGQLPPETYTWTNLTRGYKKYILESFSFNIYRQRPVYKENIITSADNLDCAIAVMPEVGQDRFSKFTKANFFFPSQKWLTNNFQGLIVTGLMLGFILYYYQPENLVLIIDLTLGCGLILNFILSLRDNWGVMRYKDGTRLAWKTIVLKNGDETIAKTLTDWEGKFCFRNIPSGNYQIWAQRNNVNKVTEVQINSNGKLDELIEIKF